MTVSIPKPNWRAVQGLRERAANAFARPRVSSELDGDSAVQASKSREWSDVMRGRSVPTTAKATTATNATTATPSAPRQPRGEVNSAWVLASMLLVVCLVAVGWLFSHGSAASLWLITLIAVGFAGVPIGLIALRLFGYDDVD